MDTTQIITIVAIIIAVIPGVFTLTQQLKKDKENENFIHLIERYKSDIKYLEIPVESNIDKMCKYCKTPAENYEKICEKCGAPL